MLDLIQQIVDRMSLTDGTALAAEAVFEDLAVKHQDDPAAAKLVAAMRERNQPAVDKTWRKTLVVALVESGAFVRTSEHCVAEKPMSANTYAFDANDNALEVLNTALKALPRWREKAAHDDLVKQWMRVPQTAGDVGDADAVSTYDDRAALRVQLQKVGDDVGFSLSESLKAAVFSAGWIRQITYDAASGVLAASRSPAGFAAMVAAAAPECRKRALGTVVLMSSDFARLTSANPDFDFVTFADLRIGGKAVLIAFGYLRDSPDFYAAAMGVMRFVPMFKVFGAQVLVKALADAVAKPPVKSGESVAVRVGNATSNDYASLERLWDTSQKHWNGDNPNRLSDAMFRPIYSIPEWMVNQVDYQEVNQYISQAECISWAPSSCRCGRHSILNSLLTFYKWQTLS
jgi:hypothetical protein